MSAPRSQVFSSVIHYLTKNGYSFLNYQEKFELHLHTVFEKSNTNNTFINSVVERDCPMKGGILMSRRRNSIMSYQLKEQIAQELGFAGTLKQEGFGGVSSRDCGNMVKMAIELAERNLPQNNMT